MSDSPTAAPVSSISLDQRGRAELEFIAGLRGGLVPLRASIKATLEKSGALQEPFTDIAGLRAATDAALADSVQMRVLGTTLRWARDQATPRAVAAFERRREVLEPMAMVADDLVEDHIDGTVPRYWDYEFHGTEGGWDGHQYMGFIHHEMIYRNVLMAAYGGDIYAIRGVVAAAAPQDHYARILDMGCGTGQYTLKLAETYPLAQITAVDISRSSVNYAMRRGADAGFTFRGIRAAAEDTKLPAESFDLVTNFIVLHEVPPHITKQILAEAFRLLAPGGDIHFSDVVPYRARTSYDAWADDWDAQNGSEPWWRTAASMNLSELAAEAGFTGIVEGGVGGGLYPWVLTARKPMAGGTGR